MKKLISLLLSALMLLGLAAAASAESAPETVTITSLNGNGEAVELEVPYDPQRIAILDMASLDILDSLGLGGRVVGSATTTLEYLQDYVPGDAIANLGTIKEADLEAVMACEPDVIFIGGRLSASYDALSEIAPVVYLSTDAEIGVVESVRNNATTIASMFGLEAQVEELMAGFDARIEALAAFAEGKTAIVGLCTSGSFNILGSDGRCSIISVEVGFENLGDSGVTSTHGNESSFELIVELSPDYMFVLDRDAAIGTDGAPSNNRMDIVDEMWLTSLIHKGWRLEPDVVKAQEVLAMVTLKGAVALMEEKNCGSLTEGKKADLIVINPRSAGMLPLHDTVANLVTSMHSDNVESTMCDGRWLMRERKLLTLDEQAIYTEAQRAADAIRRRAGIELPSRFPTC